jgi:hypothetical protein
MLQSNATLTRVSGAAGAESFEGPAAAGPEKWAGSAPAYLRERRDRQRTAEGENRTIDRLLLVERRNPDLDWRSGDVVDFTKDGAAQTATVRLVERPTVDDPDIPGELQTTRLTLETA